MRYRYEPRRIARPIGNPRLVYLLNSGNAVPLALSGVIDSLSEVAGPADVGVPDRR
ncbi:hypothetical protein GCM10009602_53350 [Nocardiopsis tropica]